MGPLCDMHRAPIIIRLFNRPNPKKQNFKLVFSNLDQAFEAHAKFWRGNHGNTDDVRTIYDQHICLEIHNVTKGTNR